MEDIREIQQRIKTGFFNDLFLMLEGRPDKDMTATMVQALLQEKMLVLGPVVEGLLSESLKPKLHYIFSILARRNMLPPMPDSMKGVPLDLEFIGVMAVAQKAASTGGLERIASLIGNLVGVYPQIKDNLDSDIFIREFNNLLANPQKVLRSPEAVQQMRDQEAKAQQAATAMAASQHMAQTADTAASAASTLADTQIGGGQQALAAILGR